MASYLTLYTEHHDINVRVSIDDNGDMHAHVDADAHGVDGEHFTLYGPPADVAALLTNLARAATDAAVAHHNPEPPAYVPTGPVAADPDNGLDVEVTTNRLACCGAGPDQTVEGVRIHLPGCARHRTANDQRVEAVAS